MRANELTPIVTMLEPIEVPPAKPVPAEEVERRRALFAKVMARRESIGPIGLPVDELIHQVRRDCEGNE